jgi:hypothetical protein
MDDLQAGEVGPMFYAARAALSFPTLSQLS